jgi:8-oxo-dGTP pyrophosphatase MutT (NUDIX family)
LARVVVVADAFLTDDAGQVLLTLPTYRPDWVPPGGDLEEGETPEAACSREVFEELGLVVTPAGLLVLDWLPPHAFRPWPAAYFLFDCGTVSDVPIRPCPDEIREHAFVPLQQATPLVTRATMRRLTAAATARTTGLTTYLADPRTR